MKPIEKPADDLRHRFMLFLAGKPENESYYWPNHMQCACGTFIVEVLHADPMPLGFLEFSRNADTEADQVWSRWNAVAEHHPRTYGALLQRVMADDRA